ncbi:MAG TPA: hypothetical protein VLK33_00220, partial [Terriglobales bacterium]|nr:hypothetical protein [Terriglobales bacterium]
RRMRALINAGYLGGPPVHMESIWCYDLGDSSYARAILGDRQHWLRKLPGQLLQNNISHGIAHLAEFLPGGSPEVTCQGFVSPLLRSIGENIVDELRVLIVDGDQTAYFTFSSRMRPSQRELRIFGPENGLIMDEDQQTLIKLSGSRYKSYAENFLPPLSFARQYIGNWAHNMRLFLQNDFHSDASKKYLFEKFYDSILNGKSPPISYREILLTTRIMEIIFAQLQIKNARFAFSSES